MYHAVPFQGQSQTSNLTLYFLLLSCAICCHTRCTRWKEVVSNSVLNQQSLVNSRQEYISSTTFKLYLSSIDNTYIYPSYIRLRNFHQFLFWQGNQSPTQYLPKVSLWRHKYESCQPSNIGLHCTALRGRSLTGWLTALTYLTGWILLIVSCKSLHL